MNVSSFGQAVYFGRFSVETSAKAVNIPNALQDIATRWRMFYFHHYMSVALEGMFAWLNNALVEHGLSGLSIEKLVEQLNAKSITRDLSTVLAVNIAGRFGELTPSSIFGIIGIPEGKLNDELSKNLDHAIPCMTTFSENELETLIRANTYLSSATGLALNLLLIATTLARYKQWEATDYGSWLASVATDTYLDLIPPVICKGLAQKFESWWETSWQDLAKYLLGRYVVRQHLTMSYEKSYSGDRCILQEDGNNVVTTGSFNKVGMGNIRFHSATQILEDLALIEIGDDSVPRLTSDGSRLLKNELTKYGAKG